MSIGKPTVIVHTTFFPVATTPAEELIDPECEAARLLGERLYDLLTRSAADRLSWGTGVQVRIATHFDRVDPDEASFVVVIPVLGDIAEERDTVREQAIATIASWRVTCAHVVPLFKARSWRAHEDAIKVKAIVTDLPPAEPPPPPAEPPPIDPAPRPETIDEIVLALARILARDDTYATRMFISHAKGDLAGTENAAETICNHVQRNTTAERPFFDRVSLLPGEELETSIDEAAEHGVFVAVRGDSYSSRSWCVRELLKAKRRKLPILVVEVLSNGERRSSAYSGNAPSVVWLRGKPEVSVQRVVTSAMVECVRSLVFAHESQRVIDAAFPGQPVIAMPRPPELLDVPTLRAGRDGEVVVLHPDPELTVHERALLLEADKQLRIVTPSTAFAGTIGGESRAPLHDFEVALSLSDEPRVQSASGITDAHVHDATVFLARALVAAGAAIGYGGDFRGFGYTELLSQLIAAYNQTARKPAELLHGYMAAHTRKPSTWTYAYSARRLGAFGALRAEALLDPPPDGSPPPPGRAALYVSDMRRVMENHVNARVVLYGSTTPLGHDARGYRGRFPGVAEEAWRSLEAGHPLYVAGGFGGAAGVVAQLLTTTEGVPRELDEARWKGNPTWDGLVAALDADPDFARLMLPPTQMALAHKIRALGRECLANNEAALRWNGLTVAENQALFATRDPLTLTALVIKGLVGIATRRERQKLSIDLIEGDVTRASELDILVFPTFTNVDLDGAGEAIDRVSDGAATRAHRSRGLYPAPKTIGAKYLFAADLGDANSAMSDPIAMVTAAAQATAEVALRYRLMRIGIVTFLGNVTANLGAAVEAMIAGLRGIPDDARLFWYERDPSRAAMLAAILEKAPKVELARIVAATEIAPEPARNRARTTLTLRQQGDDLDVTVLVPQASGLTPNIRSRLDETTRTQLAGDALDATPAEPKLSERGARIAALLFGSGARRILDAVRDTQLVIVHDSAGSGIPYEALGWGDGNNRVTPATRGGIVRYLSAMVDADRGVPLPAHAGELGVLVIVDPRGDLREAAHEGETVIEALSRNPRVKVESLRGPQATVEAICAALARPETDVVHYCGHAFYRGPGPTNSGLNCAEDKELYLSHLQALPRLPRLVIFNACQSGRVRNEAGVTAPPQSFAEFFLRSGVDAYLGTFWLVSDASATIFAAELYAKLCAGAELGDAVVAGRQLLQSRGLKDWANYLLYGRADFRLVRGAGIVPTAPTAMPVATARAEGKMIVAAWSFDANSAPGAFTMTATERFGALERPVATDGPIRVDRRDGWHAGKPTVVWVATVPLAAPAGERGFRLRSSAGDPLDVGPATAADDTRAVNLPIDELRDLRTVLEQQPDRGRELLAQLLPSSDPDVLRAEIDQAIAEYDARDRGTRAVWPLDALTPGPVDGAALTAFVAAYPKAAVERADAAEVKFQGKEDWARYASCSGVVNFVIGGELEPPLSAELGNRPVDMTHELRPGEFDGNVISVALFSDNGNGLHASKAIAQRIIEANLPYAFHLGDVYYGGKAHEFRDYFATPLAPLLDRTELFMLTGNHEMFAGGRYFKQMVRAKSTNHPQRQRQRAETFRLKGRGFQIIGLDTMFVGWRSGRMRLRDYADDDALALLDGWLSDGKDDFTILLTTNEPWDRGSENLTRLYASLRKTIAGRVDLWFWGNVHYAALFEPWSFPDAVMASRRHVIGSCIGHGGFPFYRSTRLGALPRHVDCRWYESQSRFWPETRVRPDVGLNGWCKLTLARAPQQWNAELTFIDWIGRERLRATLCRKDGESVRFERVEESALASVGATPTWRDKQTEPREP
ncbi:MAG TPA: CHAT domain-containing protein [Kofleriaceae bacterium]|nr:CHAT domain-containing protein [Kofleriaceae bacterium]